MKCQVKALQDGALQGRIMLGMVRLITRVRARCGCSYPSRDESLVDDTNKAAGNPHRSTIRFVAAYLTIMRTLSKVTAIHHPLAGSKRDANPRKERKRAIAATTYEILLTNEQRLIEESLGKN